MRACLRVGSGVGFHLELGLVLQLGLGLRLGLVLGLDPKRLQVQSSSSAVFSTEG